jgi:hypothetical protein
MQAARDVNEAIVQALDLVRSFSDRNHPYWETSPERVYEELDAARTQIMHAWEILRIQQGKISKSSNSEKAGEAARKEEESAESLSEEGADDDDNASGDLHDTSEKEGIRVAYIDMITDAFADVLENMRQQEDNEKVLDVEILCDCLQSGLEILSTSHSKLLKTDFSFREDDFDDELDDDEQRNKFETPHESRRKQLGFRKLDELETA